MGSSDIEDARTDALFEMIAAINVNTYQKERSIQDMEEKTPTLEEYFTEEMAQPPVVGMGDQLTAVSANALTLWQDG
eukprot:9711401-Heterocapsa_arctica.AAC.1